MGRDNLGEGGVHGLDVHALARDTDLHRRPQVRGGQEQDGQGNEQTHPASVRLPAREVQGSRAADGTESGGTFP